VFSRDRAASLRRSLARQTQKRNGIEEIIMDLKNATFSGYKRENGRIGVRNHVVILPVDDLSNAAAEAVAHNIKGALALPHPYGRLQFGADLELHFRTLIGTGSNPNVAAVVVIGIEEGWSGMVADAIRKTGKPVASFGIELHGDHDTIMRASRAAKEYVQWASELRREERALKDLWVSTKCGESDTTSGCGANPTVGNAFDKLEPHGVTMCFGETTEITGGEHLVAARCATPEVRDKFMFMFNRYQEVIERHKTSDLMDSQPTKGNIAGGLTTIEEKALGNIQKIGRKCKVIGVIDKAETPTGPGLWFMDSSSAAAEMVTLLGAAGYTVHFFPTGQGNVIGNPILPVIKLSANPRTVRTMSEHIDVDVSGLLRREMSPDEAGDKLLECMFRTANGRLTAAEALGHREFVLTRLYESA
jgi:(2R)-sulfolactate sulfo-lyase subunit beta